jgi:hypothetical protein
MIVFSTSGIRSMGLDCERQSIGGATHRFFAVCYAGSGSLPGREMPSFCMRK